MKFIDSQTAKKIDDELMRVENGFSIEQLMELAGLTVAQCIHDHVKEQYPEKLKGNILVICGPGNNGGDGLVAARHLKQFGYNIVIWYPKQSHSPLFLRLVKQCEQMDIQFVSKIPNETGLIVDAIFGFSFTGLIREPFDAIINKLCNTTIPIISIDIPSGWNVDDDDQCCLSNNNQHIKPSVLISLTAPKLCAAHYKGSYHYLGGRFIPPLLAQKYHLDLPYKKDDSTLFIRL